MEEGHRQAKLAKHESQIPKSETISKFKTLSSDACSTLLKEVLRDQLQPSYEASAVAEAMAGQDD